jgi:hypothetical protein
MNTVAGNRKNKEGANRPEIVYFGENPTRHVGGQGRHNTLYTFIKEQRIQRQTMRNSIYATPPHWIVRILLLHQ